MRPDESLLASLLMLLVALLGRAALPRCLALLRSIFGPLGRPRARAATPAQHRRALRQLRTLPPRLLYVRARPYRASRAARRRIAECWRMLINPPRRRPSFARPQSAARPCTPALRPLRTRPHARAGPARRPNTPSAPAPSHVHFVTIS